MHFYSQNKKHLKKHCKKPVFSQHSQKCVYWTVFVLNAAAFSSAEPAIKIYNRAIQDSFHSFHEIPSIKMRRKFSRLKQWHGVHRPWHQRQDPVVHWRWRFCILRLLSTPELEMWKQKDRNKHPAHVREAHGIARHYKPWSSRGKRLWSSGNTCRRRTAKGCKRNLQTWIAGGLPVSHLSMLVSGLSLA